MSLTSIDHVEISTSPCNRRDLLSGFSGLITLGMMTGTLNDALGEEAIPETLVLKNLTQIAFVVKDIVNESASFADTVGIPAPEIILTAPLEQSKMMYRGKPSPAQAKLAFIKLGSLDIELIEPVSEPSIWNDVLKEKGEGLHHLAFQVTDLNAMLAHLTRKGFETIQTGDFGTGRYAYVDTTPSLKTLIELLEIVSK